MVPSWHPQSHRWLYDDGAAGEQKDANEGEDDIQNKVFHQAFVPKQATVVRRNLHATWPIERRFPGISMAMVGRACSPPRCTLAVMPYAPSKYHKKTPMTSSPTASATLLAAHTTHRHSRRRKQTGATNCFRTLCSNVGCLEHGGADAAADASNQSRRSPAVLLSYCPSRTLGCNVKLQ